MRRSWFVILAIFSLLAPGGAMAAPPDLRSQVVAFVRDYTDAANRADVAALMEMYARGSTVISVDNGTIRRGWEAVREDANQALGKEGSYKISVGSVDVIPLGTMRAVAVGPFVATVQTQGGPVELRGALTLVLEKRQGKWLILHDHTSTESPGQE